MFQGITHIKVFNAVIVGDKQAALDRQGRLVATMLPSTCIHGVFLPLPML